MRNLEDSLQPSHIASTHYAARQSPRPVTDSGETSEEHSSEGVGSSHCDRNKDDDNGSDAAEQSDKNDDLEISRDSQETTKSLPQHQMEAFAELSLDAAMRCRRQKVILLSRLQESAQRGRLSQINFSHRDLTAADAVLLGEAIRSNPQVSVLKLSYNDLGDEGVSLLTQSLVHNGRHHQKLSVLDLSFNSIADKGCEVLATHFIAGNMTLQTLCLTGNQIGPKGALSIAGALLQGTSLSRLHLSVNAIGVMGMKGIAGAIATESQQRIKRPNTRGVEELHVGSASIESEGFIAIAGMLLYSSSLRILCVTNNNVDDGDVNLLAQALTQNKGLPIESLQLSFNGITCKGVECLMNAIWGSKTLREIKLDNNRIKDRGAQLCAVVLTSIDLEVLDLGFNRITTTGIKALMKNISESQSLKVLSLCGIPIDQNASKAISFAMAYNASLQNLHLDNCSTGYSSQRHIVAGIVSNRKTALRVMSGFHIGPIAITLGVPRLPEDWSNEQVLGFFRLMWQQWLLKSGRGNALHDDRTVRGPAPPAAVAAASRIAFTSLGGSREQLFRAELHEKSPAELPPIDPASVALMERTASGTMRVPYFSDAEYTDLDEWYVTKQQDSSKGMKEPSKYTSTVRAPLDDPERRNKNLQWLRLHFRSLNEVGRFPFNSADLWQLHQYYFSPPVSQNNEGMPQDSVGSSDHSTAVPTMDVTVEPGLTRSLDRVLSYQTLGAALAAVVSEPNGNNKRRPDSAPSDSKVPATKKAKSLKPPIAYYPRIMSKVQSLGTKPMDQTLSLLRQLKYAESVAFVGKNPYVDVGHSDSDEFTHSDIEMILLDLL